MSRRVEIVTPGEEICVIEEFLPVDGAYDDGKGKVRSIYVGAPEYDIGNHVVKVRKITNRPRLPLANDVVFALVTDVKDTVSTCKIFEIENYGRLSVPFTGILHITQVSTMYVKSLYDVVRNGDIIRAWVLNNNTPYLLSIKGREYGVIRALCSQCLTPLLLKGFTLYCPRCKKEEKRKVSFKYYIRMR
ncbi:MAG: RNA-binding protein [Thermoprotei archaeon]|nr:MAG: RNA-binding protein [Thermoprotei archaeon]